MTHTPSQSDGSMTIGDLAKAAGVNVETIRFYQRKGLMPEPDRPLGSIRRYGRTDQSRLSFIKSAKRLGFSLDETAQLLQLEDGESCIVSTFVCVHTIVLNHSRSFKMSSPAAYATPSWLTCCMTSSKQSSELIRTRRSAMVCRSCMTRWVTTLNVGIDAGLTF